MALSEKLRPQKLEDLFGQEHITGAKSALINSIQNRSPFSFILFGPPGCGKTSLARLYGTAFDSRFISLSAVSTKSTEIKKILNSAKETVWLNSSLLLFIDEIHRLNKAQQDIFLPYLEEGSIILIGATTENPSFALNSALLSRLRVFSLKSLSSSDLDKILQRYEREVATIPLDADGKKLLLELSQGDARHLLNLLEHLKDVKEPLTREELLPLLQKRAPLYDKQGEFHYNLISALHKAIRGSDVDATLYWLLRMLEGGEDPLYIGRRFIRMAVEDVGVADPQALTFALSAYSAYEHLGSPEGELALVEVAIYLALAPKSNSSYTAYLSAKESASSTSHLPPPSHILNAPTQLMQDMGYGKGYIYDHDTKEGFSGQNYFPSEMKRPKFYFPQERGFEREMKKRLDFFENLRRKKNS